MLRLLHDNVHVLRNVFAHFSPKIKDSRVLSVLVLRDCAVSSLASDTVDGTSGGSGSSGVKSVRLRAKGAGGGDGDSRCFHSGMGKRTASALCMADDDDPAAAVARREWVLKDRTANPLPYVTPASMRGVGGILKVANAHFRVTEWRDGRAGPGDLSGKGGHVYVTVWAIIVAQKLRWP